MVVRVVADVMSLVDDPLHDLWIPRRFAAYEKESCAHAMGAEHIQHSWGVHWMRSIVERQADTTLPRSARQEHGAGTNGGDRATQNLPPRHDLRPNQRHVGCRYRYGFASHQRVEHATNTIRRGALANGREPPLFPDLIASTA